MRRAIGVGAIVAVLVGMFALPAWAKGEGQTVSGSVTITGPGLPGPIDFDGKTPVLDLYGGGGSGGAAPSGFVTLLENSGLYGADPDAGWYVLAPDPKSLGPEYSVVYVLKSADGAIQRLTQTLYPYAPGRPIFHWRPEGGSHIGTNDGLWFSAPTAILQLLIAQGLPASPPRAAGPAPASETTSQPVVNVGISRVWIALGMIGALTLLLVGGAAAGRRRSVRAI